MSSNLEKIKKYQQAGRKVPIWLLNSNAQEQLSLNNSYDHTQDFLAALASRNDLLANKDLQPALELLKRACAAVEAISELPQNTPRHRDQVRELFSEGWAIVYDLRDQGLDLPE